MLRAIGAIEKHTDIHRERERERKTDFCHSSAGFCKSIPQLAAMAPDTSRGPFSLHCARMQKSLLDDLGNSLSQPDRGVCAFTCCGSLNLPL